MEILRNCNMFAVCKEGDTLCITTNGVLKKNGDLVMGRGVAKQAVRYFPGLASKLGVLVLMNGNVVNVVHGYKYNVVSFPTKNNWMDDSDLSLIEKSLEQLVSYNFNGDIYLPAPGCSNGKLDWESQVKPLCEKYLKESKYKLCLYDWGY